MKSFINYLLYQVNFPTLKRENSTHLDLGSGRNIRNPFGAHSLYGIDLSLDVEVVEANSTYLPADLTRNLPFADNFFETISAFDVLEHIPRWERLADGQITYPFVNLMSEIHRILKPGGMFVAVTPAFPAPEAFQDPTHINFITDSTIEYFLGESPHAATVGYGFVGRFELVHQSWLRGSGPFESLSQRLKPGLASKNEFTHLLRLINRMRKLLRRQPKSHLVWVISAIK